MTSSVIMIMVTTQVGHKVNGTVKANSIFRLHVVAKISTLEILNCL